MESDAGYATNCLLESILIPLQSWNLFPHVIDHLPLAEGINVGVIPKEVLPVMKEGQKERLPHRIWRLLCILQGICCQMFLAQKM